MLQWPVENASVGAIPALHPANVIEVFPDPVSPLTMSLFFFDATSSGRGYLEMGFRDAHVRLGSFEYSEFPDTESVFLGAAGAYAYLNASTFRSSENAPRACPPKRWTTCGSVPNPGSPHMFPRPAMSAQISRNDWQKTFEWCLSIDGRAGAVGRRGPGGPDPRPPPGLSLP